MLQKYILCITVLKLCIHVKDFKKKLCIQKLNKFSNGIHWNFGGIITYTCTSTNILFPLYQKNNFNVYLWNGINTIYTHKF